MASKDDSTEVVRKTLEASLNRAVARVADAKAELRKATADERRIRAELGRSPLEL